MTTVAHFHPKMSESHDTREISDLKTAADHQHWNKNHSGSSTLEQTRAHTRARAHTHTHTAVREKFLKSCTCIHVHTHVVHIHITSHAMLGSEFSASLIQASYCIARVYILYIPCTRPCWFKKAKAQYEPTERQESQSTTWYNQPDKYAITG